MKVQLAKRKDGAGVLRCIRPDGSQTWQKQKDRHAAFFAQHDLTHFAVETVLGYQRGFFGLLREGWDMEDTDGKGPRGRLPVEAGEVEYVVGMFSLEVMNGADLTADEFNSSMKDYFAAAGVPGPSRQFIDEDLVRVRTRRRELLAQWDEIQPGETLHLTLQE